MMLSMYSTAHCPACVVAAKWLESRGIAFSKVDVTNDLAMIQQLVVTTGQRTVPQFFHDGHWLSGGFADVKRLASQGKL
jgi:glutaredoxin 3